MQRGRYLRAYAGESVDVKRLLASFTLLFFVTNVYRVAENKPAITEFPNELYT